jgi:hypothetical protein
MIAHPNFAKFVEVIQKEDEVVRIKIQQAENGKFRMAEKKFLREKRIKLIVQNFEFFKNGGFYNAICDVYDWEFSD